jgi:hypothetical protein
MAGSTKIFIIAGVYFTAQTGMGAINVALFLAFGCNKQQQTAASGGTKRSSKIVGFY